MKILSVMALCTLLFACANTRNMKNDEQVNPKTVTAQLGDVTLDSDPLTINSVSIDGNIMTIDIEYSGGCEEHWVDLIGSFSVMKSLPAKRSIKLMHTANNDNCRKIVNETLMFDISAFAMRATSGSEIILLLDGYKGQISYIHP